MNYFLSKFFLAFYLILSARKNLVENNLFIFVSPSDSALDGKILSVTCGCTVADALEEVENNFRVNRVSTKDVYEIYLNGKTINDISTVMKNGDVLTLPCLG